MLDGQISLIILSRASVAVDRIMESSLFVFKRTQKNCLCKHLDIFCALTDAYNRVALMLACLLLLM